MSFYRLSLIAISAAILLFSIFMLDVSSAKAQFPALEVKVADTIAYSGQPNAIIPVYMKNCEDTVAAFVLTLTTDHTEYVQFRTDAIDTTGSLISGWQFVNINPAFNSGVRIAAMANIVDPPYTPGIGYPQLGDIPLLKVLADINALPDSLFSLSVSITIVDSLNHFGFSDGQGNTLYLAYDTTYDTGWYNCIEWMEDPPGDSTCMGWEPVSGPPADSTAVELILNPYLDTVKVNIMDGSLRIKRACQMMGDVDGTESVNMLDIIYLVAYLYKNGPIPYRLAHADVDCSCTLSMLDILGMIEYLYRSGGRSTFCSCQEWEDNCITK
jgi:hypothetical protein